MSIPQGSMHNAYFPFFDSNYSHWTVLYRFSHDIYMSFLFSGKGNKMNIVRRIGAVLLSLLMILGITTQSVSAASYKMEWHGKSTAYGSTVGNFTIDGRRAWCIEHKKTTPSNQTDRKSVV